MLKKNEIVRLEISGMTNEGNGVGKHEGIAVFVPFTVIGDVIDCKIVKVCKTYCYGIIENIVSGSAQRVENDCPVYSKCGGCCFRHMSYEEECHVKEQFIKDSFERIGKYTLSMTALRAASSWWDTAIRHNILLQNRTAGQCAAFIQDVPTVYATTLIVRCSLLYSRR